MNDLKNSPLVGERCLTLPKNAATAFHLLAKPRGSTLNLG